MDKHKRREYEFFDLLPGALIEVDLASRKLVYMNRIAFSLFDFNQNDIDTGIPLRDIFLNDAEYERSIKVAESFGLESYQNHTAYTRYEHQDLHDFMLKKRDGSGFYGECQGSFVLDDHRVPVGVRIYIRDLTKQRLMEVSLHQNEMKYRTLVENSSDLIWLVDTHGTVLSVNAAVTHYLGKEAEDIEGQRISDLFQPQTANTFLSYVNRTLISGESDVYETNMPTTRKKIWISTSITPVRDTQGNITSILGVSRDITERIRSRERLEQALVEAKNANQVKDQFIQNISHEIRTPLTSILGYTDRLKQRLGSRMTEEELDYFKFITSNSERLIRTIDAILNVSQLEAGTLTLSPKLIHLKRLIGLICDKVMTLAVEKGLDLKLSSDVQDDRILLDEASMYRAILNIIENAVKYTMTGQVIVHLSTMNDQMILTVSDSGIGISEEYRNSMFQLFSQESQGLTKNFQGIGLGLALTKRYLDMNDVSIQVESEKGKGSTFTLTFPASL